MINLKLTYEDATYIRLGLDSIIENLKTYSEKSKGKKALPALLKAKDNLITAMNKEIRDANSK